jgi:hypothetical protein
LDGVDMPNPHSKQRADPTAQDYMARCPDCPVSGRDVRHPDGSRTSIVAVRCPVLRWRRVELTFGVASRALRVARAEDCKSRPAATVVVLVRRGRARSASNVTARRANTVRRVERGSFV